MLVCSTLHRVVAAIKKPKLETQPRPLPDSLGPQHHARLGNHGRSRVRSHQALNLCSRIETRTRCLVGSEPVTAVQLKIHSACWSFCRAASLQPYSGGGAAASGQQRDQLLPVFWLISRRAGGPIWKYRSLGGNMQTSGKGNLQTSGRVMLVPRWQLRNVRGAEPRAWCMSDVSVGSQRHPEGGPGPPASRVQQGSVHTALVWRC